MHEHLRIIGGVGILIIATLFSDDALDFFQELGECTKEATDDPLSYHKLCQRINVTVQKFNSIAIGNICME